LRQRSKQNLPQNTRISEQQNEPFATILSLFDPNALTKYTETRDSLKGLGYTNMTGTPSQFSL
jgi:hypothetical protein